MSETAFRIVGLLIGIIGITSSVLAQDWNDRARNDFFNGQPAKAENSLEQALEVNPFDAVALNNLAVAKAEQGD